MKAKKTKYFVFLAVLMLLLAPIFSGCTTTIKLNEPLFVNYQVNSTTGEQMLITENNTKASGWVFGISTVYNEEDKDVSHFFTYTRDVPYFYVTEIFKNAQTYYFYSQALGTGDYTTSDISKVEQVTIQYKLDAPVLELSGTTLSWTTVKNANTYIVYANDVVVIETTKNSFDIAEYVQTQNNLPYTFTVACKQNNNYLKSAKSNEKLYTAHLKLSTPTNLAVNGYSNKMLTWNAVSNCNKYKVIVNNTIELDAYSNQLNITSLYNQYGVGAYFFKVMAIGEGYFGSSEYSSVLTDVYTMQLSTPTNLQSAVADSFIKLSWDLVENASEYALYINGQRFYVNQDTGINSPILTNCVIINKQQLLNYDFNLLKFNVQALALSGSYYTDSGISNEHSINTQLSVLSAPVISVDSVNNRIAINSVKDAVSYKLDYTFDGQSQEPIYINAGISTIIYVNYKTQFGNIGNYTLTVTAIAEHQILNSQASNQVTFTIEPEIKTLTAPVLQNICVSGDNFMVEFDPVDPNSQSFSLYANDNLITTVITQANNYVALDMVFDIVGSCSNLKFCIAANSVDAHTLASVKSNNFNLSTQLTKLSNLRRNGESLSWSPVKNAQTYCLILDNQVIDLHSLSTTVNPFNYIPENKTRLVNVIAKTKYFKDSNESDVSFYFNNVSSLKEGYTDKFFNFGESYDFYITSQKELNDLIDYAVNNRIENIDFYIAFNTTSINSEKVNEALDNLAITTPYYSTSLSGASSKNGVCSLTVNYRTPTDYVEHTPEYKQYSKVYQYKSQIGRASNFMDFAIDKSYITQVVYTTDGLVKAVENQVKPAFPAGNAEADKVQKLYLKSKQILRTICDDGMTDYQKALAIHDYIVMNVTYDNYGLKNSGYSKYSVGYYHYLESIFDYGLGVCDAYAKFYSLLCNIEGLKTITVGGSSDKNDISNTGHAWNKSYLDADGDGQKEWYSVDVTWDDLHTTLNGIKYELLSHEYFMIPDSYIGERYEDIEYPQSTTDNQNYFNNFTISGNVLKIDTESQWTAIVNYFKSSTLVGIEILLNTSVNTSSSSVNKYSFNYDFNSKYYHVYFYK